MGEEVCKSSRFPMFVHMFYPKLLKSAIWLSTWIVGCCLPACLYAQHMKTPAAVSWTARRWVDSVMRHMDTVRKIAQLMMIRVYNPPNADQAAQVTHAIQDLGVGGIVFFQGDPVQQALLTNQYQAMSAVPLWVGIDGEWGLAMRLQGGALSPSASAGCAARCGFDIPDGTRGGSTMPPDGHPD